MTNTTRRASPATLPLALSILLGGVSLPSVASAQTAEERLTALEQALAGKKGELRELEEQLQALKQHLGLQVAPPLPVPPSSSEAPDSIAASQPESSALPICRMESWQDFEAASEEPASFAKCPIKPKYLGPDSERPRVERIELAEKEARERQEREGDGRVELLKGLRSSTGKRDLAEKIAQPLPERPNQFPGVSTTLQVAGGTKASITYSHPIIMRKWFGTDFEAQRPQILSLVGSLTVPVDKGASNILTRTDDIDVLPGTTFKFGVDFASFRKADADETYRRIADFLYDAMKTCATATGVKPVPVATRIEFYQRYGLKRDEKGRWRRGGVVGPAWTEPCTGERLMAWVRGTTRNELYPDIVKWDQEALVTAFQALFWRPEENAVPDWGAGASVEIGTNDFKFRQGVVSVDEDPNDPTRVVLNLNRNQELATEAKLTHEDWKLQGYVSYFKRFRRNDYLRPILGLHNEGIRGILSASYLSVYDYRPGAKDLSICPIPKEGQKLASCATANVEAPVLRDGLVLGAELRTQWINVPIVNVLGLAPKYSHRPEDHFQTVDLPIYLTSEKGVGTAGVRISRSWNGKDLLGNDIKPKWDVSLFFSTPLSFIGF